MLQSAVFLTRPPSGFIGSTRWPALIDMRRDQARSLSLAGAAAAVDDVIIYAVEGSADAVDGFLQLLGVSPCETEPIQAWRQEVRFRFHRVLALSHPPLLCEEAAALRRALDADNPAYGEIPALLAAAALRWSMLTYRTPLQATTRLIAS